MIHLLQGYAFVRGDNGEITWRSPHLRNALMNQGEKDVLDVYLREQAHKEKWLGLFDMAGGDDPREDDTISTLNAEEIRTPGTGGYARQEILAADWNVPVVIDDYRSLASQKIFGPISGTDATFTHIIMLTSETGISSPVTLALSYLALGMRVEVAVGLTFTYAPAMAAF